MHESHLYPFRFGRCHEHRADNPFGSGTRNVAGIQRISFDNQRSTHPTGIHAHAG